MDVLFQIGKELAALEARVKAMEGGGKCSCKSGSREAKDSELPKEQLATVKQLRSKHKEIIAGFNKVLKEAKLPPSLVVGKFTLMDKDVMEGDDVDLCCMSCLNGSDGYEYCCDYNNCACCD